MTTKQLKDQRLNKDITDRVIHMTEKLLSLWRRDKDRAHDWFMEKDPLVRLLLVVAIKEVAVAPRTSPQLEADCKALIIYLNGKYPTS
jgi:hypothetical protein